MACRCDDETRGGGSGQSSTQGLERAPVCDGRVSTAHAAAMRTALITNPSGTDLDT